MKHTQTLYSVALCAALACTTAHADTLPGFDHLTIAAPHRATVMQASIWYPAGRDTYRTLVGDNPIFIGREVMLGAALAPGQYPLVLLSHGSGGNVDTMAWLAEPLVKAGAVVVGLNHPGSTSGDSSPRRSILLQDRTADVSALLTQVLADPVFGPAIDPAHITMLGFSMGGATALQLGGARLDRAAYRAYCDRAGEAAADCLFFAKGGVDLTNLPEGWDGDQHDARFTKVIAIDPGMTQAMTPQSIAAMTSPTLLINLDLNGTRPIAIDVGPLGSNLAARLPNAEWQQISPAHHFTFLPACKPDAALLLKDEGEDPICDDPANTDRNAIHRAIAQTIVDFVKR